MHIFKRFGTKKSIAVGIIILIAAGFAVSELTGTSHVLHKKTAVVATGSSFSTKGESKKSSSNSNGSGNPTNTTTTNSSNKPATAVTVLTPTGNFVSNHHPNLSGSPAPNTMSSVCDTAPAVSCKIVFTMNGVTKSLPAETTDANGVAYWNWKLQDIGLTAGTWKVQAEASANGQTKTATDAMDLVVAP